MKLRHCRVLVMSACLTVATVGQASAGEVVVSNSVPISINPIGAASPYPTQITVGGLEGNVQDVTVTLNGVSHWFPQDIDVLLVGPNGQKLMLMSDVGGGSQVTGAYLTFSANAASALSQTSTFSTGAYLPTDIDVDEDDSFPSAPGPAYSLDLASLRGPASNLNGIWSLYVVDDGAGDNGSIAGGWTLTFNVGSGGGTDDGTGFDSCAAEGYSGSQYALCHQICEANRSRSQGLQGLTNAWKRQFDGTDPPCLD